jgi:SAM-dependent methyltransferase
MPILSHPEICPICKSGRKFKFIRGFLKDQAKYSLYQCLDCQVQFWLPLELERSQWYEKTNPYRVRELIGVKIYRGYHKTFLKRNKAFPEDAKILDLGCGTGEFISELKKRGCQVWGLDFDRKAIKIARQQFGLENVYSLSFEEFFKKENLPKFDIITFFEVLEHLDNPLEFVQNVKSLLKPDGRIVLSVPSRERMLANLNNWDFPPHHFTRWNKEAILNLFQKFDFHIFNISYVEEFRILLESITGKFKTGWVSKSLDVSKKKRKPLILTKIMYYLGRLKGYIIGTIPAGLLWALGKITGRKNGIMLIELKHSL